MHAPLAGKVALVTGGARGIGRATALKLAAAGADVAINYYNSHEDAEALAGEVRAMGRHAATIQCSVGDPDSVDELFAAFDASFARLDIVVSNAAIYPFSLVHDISVEEWDEVLGVNLRGAFLIARAALEPL